MKANSKKFKGIILAGGIGSRLKPLTNAISKQLLPVNDKPMIYYPLSVLMLAEIREILIISSKEHINLYKRLFNDGSNLGLKITYSTQNDPNGIADSLLIGKKFLGEDSCFLILGDNIFYGQSFTELLKKAKSANKGASIFTHTVNNPKEFGVLYNDRDGKPIKIIEKPKNPSSNQVVTGLYILDNSSLKIAKNIKPSPRGELEITYVLNEYIKLNKLTDYQLGRGFTWLDMGNHESLLDASLFIKTIETRQENKIACLEEIALKNNWINQNILKKQIRFYKNSPYGEYLKKLLKK